MRSRLEFSLFPFSFLCFLPTINSNTGRKMRNMRRRVREEAPFVSN